MTVGSTIVRTPAAASAVSFCDGVGDPRVLVAPLLRVVLLHVGGQHEDVLVHVRPAELGGVDGTPTVGTSAM